MLNNAVFNMPPSCHYRLAELWVKTMQLFLACSNASLIEQLSDRNCKQTCTDKIQDDKSEYSQYSQ